MPPGWDQGGYGICLQVTQWRGWNLKFYLGSLIEQASSKSDCAPTGQERGTDTLVVTDPQRRGMMTSVTTGTSTSVSSSSKGRESQEGFLEEVPEGFSFGK